MSKQEIKKTGNRLWDLLNLVACTTGGAILAFSKDTPSLYNTNISLGQVVGAILLATVTVRVAHLVMNEERS